jgi:biopolymer transport protein ExbD
MSRQGRLKRHHDDKPPEPRVPVIPMLDMAFQLLAFGLYCFDLNPDKVEGQMTMALPKQGADAPSPTDVTTIDEPPEEFTIRVASDGTGRVSGVELTSTKIAEPQKLPLTLAELQSDLKARVEAKAEAKEPAPKLDVQFDPDLPYQVVFDFLSAANEAKFKKVTPNLLTAPPPKPKEEGPPP